MNSSREASIRTCRPKFSQQGCHLCRSWPVPFLYSCLWCGRQLLELAATKGKQVILQKMLSCWRAATKKLLHLRLIAAQCVLRRRNDHLMEAAHIAWKLELEAARMREKHYLQANKLQTRAVLGACFGSWRCLMQKKVRNALSQICLLQSQ